MSLQQNANLLRSLIFTASMLPVAFAPDLGQAQERCPDPYVIGSGDTLYSIAEECGTTVGAILDENPGLGSPRSIEVGYRLAMPGGQEPYRQEPVSESRRGYTVKSGDTLNSIAIRFGIDLDELLAENENLDPFRLVIGDVINLPGNGDDGTRRASMEIKPKSGPAETEVTVRGYGLHPGRVVTIGVGPDNSEWSAVRDVEVAADGEILENVEMPDYADPGDEIVFVIDRPNGDTLRSADFHVESENRDGRPGQIELEGRVRSGTECAILVTPDGDRYSLVSDRYEFTPGEYVEIKGRRAEMSFCMSGTTVEVTSLRETEPS